MSLFLMLLFALAPQKPATPALKPLPVVSLEVMQTLLPEADGWTRGPLTGDIVHVTDDSGYSFAVADFAKGTAKLHLTIGDTVGVGDCLMALAAMITVLPEGYSEAGAGDVHRAFHLRGVPRRVEMECVNILG